MNRGQGRQAEITTAIQVNEQAALLQRCPGWTEWLKPWLQDESKKRWEILRRGEPSEVKQAQHDLDLLEEILGKPEAAIAVNRGILQPADRI